MKYILTFLSIGVSIFIHGQSVLCKWQSLDDETGKSKSIVELYEQPGEIYRKVIQLFREPTEDQNPLCSKCEDDRKDQLLLGMQIIRDIQLKDGYYQYGTICDPKNGKVYRCEFWLDASDNNKLQLRG